MAQRRRHADLLGSGRDQPRSRDTRRRVEFAKPFLDENAYSISVVPTANKWHENASGLLKGRTKERQQAALRLLPIDGKERSRRFEWMAIGKWR